MAEDAPARGGDNSLVTLLAVATAILALIVGLLVWPIVDWETIDPPPGDPPPGVDAIAAAVSLRLEQDGFLKKSHFDSRMDHLDAAASSLLKAEEFRRAIAELKRALGSACCGSVPVPPPAGGRQPHFWVVFDNAKLEEEGEDGRSALERLTASSPGIAIGYRQRERLDRLAAALRACATSAHRVVLNIKGYSSTREFENAQGEPLQDSQALNVKAANLRTESVTAHLLEQGVHAENGIDVQHVLWQDYHEMKRPFLDSHEEIESTDQELLNRAVHVELVDAGGCAVDAADRTAR